MNLSTSDILYISPCTKTKKLKKNQTSMEHNRNNETFPEKQRRGPMLKSITVHNWTPQCPTMGVRVLEPLQKQ